MATYKVFHFTIGSTRYSIKDRFSGSELDSYKYYLFSVLSSDITIYFQFDTTISKDVRIDIFSNPTLATNGIFLYNPQSLVNIYSDPLITSEGSLEYGYETADLGTIDIKLTNNTNYLLKITPLDINDNSLGMKLKDDVDNLKDVLKSVNKMRESRLELISIINNINNNTFTTDDIIPTIKKLANTEKAIINMLLDI